MGATVPVAHIDEIAYFNYIWITFPTLIAATIRASEDAQSLGKRCSNIYTTTAGRPDTKTGEFAFNLLNESARFTEHMYDCKDRPDLVDMIQKNSPKRKTMVYSVFSHRQLGKTDEWLRAVVLRTSATSQADVDRDYLNIWKSGQENGPIPPELLKNINASVTEAKHIEIADNYITRWYAHEEQVNTSDFKNKSIILGMDTSEQIGLDDTSFVGIDPEDAGVLCTLRCNDTNIIRLARRVTETMLAFPKMILVPECKSTGRAIVDYIIDELINRGINPWTRIYNLAIQKKDEDQYKDFNIYMEQADGLNRKLFGYTTSGGNGMHSRNNLYKTVMMKALKLNHSRIRDDQIAKQLCQLAIRNGRIDHLQGGHDDLVVSYLLACYFLFFGKNLHMYGLDRSLLLNSISADGSHVDPKQRAYDNDIRGQLDKLDNLLKSCPPSDLIKHSYLRKINDLQRMLDQRIVTEDIPVTKTQLDRQTRRLSDRALGINLNSAQHIGRFFM